jgi:hypothetical protein
MFLLFPVTNFRPLFWTMQVRHEDFSFCKKIGSSTAATTAVFFKECDALLQPLFDFALAEALSANIHELLEATYLYSAATKFPICSTLLSAMLRFKQLEYAVISSTTLASAVSSFLKYKLESQGVLNPTKLVCQTPAATVA